MVDTAEAAELPRVQSCVEIYNCLPHFALKESSVPQIDLAKC